MAEAEINRIDAKKPESQLLLYLLVALVSFIVILSLTGVSIHRIYSGHIIRSAEEDAVDISEAVLEEEKGLLIATTPEGKPRLEVDKGRLGSLDRDVRKFLQVFSIVKIKIYNPQSEIIYSTDPTIIGKVDPANKRLKNALLGSNDSKLETKDKVIDLGGERKFDVDVVETYVPVRAGRSVIGSFEIYMDVTRYRSALRNVVAMSVSAVAFVLFIVFAPSFLLIRRGTIRAQEELRLLNEELELKVEERTRQLREAQEELVRKEKLSILGQLSGSVGHELRNPLGVMSNAVYFLKAVTGGGDETVAEYLGIIEKGIANSQRIIGDLLNFARSKPPQRQRATAGELVRLSLERCAIPENVTVTVDVPDDLSSLYVDSLQMGQVLENFITNGVQAMPGGGALRVVAQRVGAIHESSLQNTKQEIVNLIEISVTDTGEGITAENKKKLFQPLFTTKPRGIGLGLVVCKNLVEANGGRIEVESEVGKGTTFRVMLPAEE